MSKLKRGRKGSGVYSFKASWRSGKAAELINVVDVRPPVGTLSARGGREALEVNSKVIRAG